MMPSPPFSTARSDASSWQEPPLFSVPTQAVGQFFYQEPSTEFARFDRRPSFLFLRPFDTNGTFFLDRQMERLSYKGGSELPFFLLSPRREPFPVWVCGPTLSGEICNLFLFPPHVSFSFGGQVHPLHRNWRESVSGTLSSSLSPVVFRLVATPFPGINYCFSQEGLGGLFFPEHLDTTAFMILSLSCFSNDGWQLPGILFLS